MTNAERIKEKITEIIDSSEEVYAEEGDEVALAAMSQGVSGLMVICLAELLDKLDEVISALHEIDKNTC